MKEVKGDVWEYPAEVICIPTNGDIKNDGTAVMGKGVALQAKERFPWLPERLGKEMALRGNVGLPLGDLHSGSPMLRSFPVKNSWRDPADLDLIKESAQDLAKLARMYHELTYVLPRPGCGYGQRDWETEVKPVIESILPDNVHVIEL